MKLIPAIALAFPAAVFGAGDYQRIDAQVTMSDGVAIDASLYLPEGDARVPLIVRQHGGGSNKDSPYDVKYGLIAVETGRYALLMYSARGHGESGGLFDFFGARTTQDFSEVLDWVAAGHGDRIDTGNVGSSGYSQGGGGSLLPAAFDDRIKALAVGQTFADLNHALNPEDCFKFAFATGIFLGAYTSTLSLVDYPTVLRWGVTFYTDTEDVATPLLPSTTAQLAERSPATYLQAYIDRKLPVFWTQAWEDQIFPGDHPERILQPLAAAGAPVHYWFSSGGHAAGGNYLPDEEAREQAMLEWFDQYLLDIDRGYGSRPRVDYWQRATGAPRKPGEWEHHTAPAWPVPGARQVRFYPQADGSLGAAPGTGTAMLLNDLASFNFANDALVLELAANAPGLGSVLESIPEGANPLDTVTYTSPELTAPLDVVGAPLVHVSQTTTALSVQQLSAKVWDSGPEGVQLIWRGAVSAAPAAEREIRLWPNAHRFEPGHRMVLTLSAVDFPTFKPDVEPWMATVALEGTYVELPVVESAAEPSAKESSFGGAMSWGVLLLLVGWARSAAIARQGARRNCRAAAALAAQPTG